MNDTNANQVTDLDLLNLTRDIVVAAAASARVTDLGAAIKEVHAALSGLSSPQVAPEPERKPFVSARQSVTHENVTCMHCGFVGKSLRRHLLSQHGQSPEQYREFWGLKPDHAIVAPGYSERRSQLAKDNGLGRKS